LSKIVNLHAIPAFNIPAEKGSLRISKHSLFLIQTNGGLPGGEI